MNSTGDRPYRSKMACTPAMAFRLFSSLESVGFSAGPGGGIAAAATALWPNHEKKSTVDKTFKTKCPFLSSY